MSLPAGMLAVGPAATGAALALAVAVTMGAAAAVVVAAGAGSLDDFEQAARRASVSKGRARMSPGYAAMGGASTARAMHTPARPCEGRRGCHGKPLREAQALRPREQAARRRPP